MPQQLLRLRIIELSELVNSYQPENFQMSYRFQRLFLHVCLRILGQLFLLLALGLAIPPNYREECAFLQSAGLEDMIVELSIEDI